MTWIAIIVLVIVGNAGSFVAGVWTQDDPDHRQWHRRIAGFVAGLCMWSALYLAYTAGGAG